MMRDQFEKISAHIGLKKKSFHKIHVTYRNGNKLPSKKEKSSHAHNNATDSG